jgi:hypothetical protein
VRERERPADVLALVVARVRVRHRRSIACYSFVGDRSRVCPMIRRSMWDVGQTRSARSQLPPSSCSGHDNWECARPGRRHTVGSPNHWARIGNT